MEEQMLRTVQLNLRLSEALRERIANSAGRAQRSMNAEITARLEASFARDAEFGSEEETSLARLIAAAFSLGGRRGAAAQGHPDWTAREWLVDPVCYAAATAAAISALNTAQPVEVEERSELHRELMDYAARVAGAGAAVKITKRRQR
jgi:hypothetical protein